MNTILTHAANQDIRRMASSGGLVKTLLAWLVESGQVDAAVIVRSGDGARFRPEAIATDDLQVILSPLTNSTYYPVPMRAVLAGLNPSRRYAACLLPCDAAWLAARRNRGEITCVEFVVSLLCNAVPQPSFTAEILGRLGVDPSAVSSLRYRGDGWPGCVTIHHGARQTTLGAVAAWGTVPPHIPPTCLRCPCLTCPPCDLMAADPWGLAGIGDGKTLARLVTDRARDAIAACVADGRLRAEPVEDAIFDRLLASTAATKRRRAEESRP